MDAAKAKKLQDYASFLAKQAESKEQQGNSAEAARDYVKLVDILLLLANEAKDHPTWQQMISRAEYYQKKVKALGSSSDQAQKFSTSDTSQSIAREKGVELPAPPQSRASPDPAGSPSSLLKSFRKIPGLMGKNSTSPEIQKSQTPEVSVSSETRSSAPATWMTEFPKTSPSFESKDQAALAASPSYAEIIAENERLKARIVTLESNERDYATAFEEMKGEAERRIASTVPKQEFEALQLKLLESVPKSEYDKVKQELRESVPRERLKEAERYTSELEARLENSVPRTVLNQISEYTSLLISTASIPLLDAEATKPMNSSLIEAAGIKEGRKKIVSLEIQP